jgi:hypothetical protein
MAISDPLHGMSKNNVELPRGSESPLFKGSEDENTFSVEKPKIPVLYMADYASGAFVTEETYDITRA